MTAAYNVINDFRNGNEIALEALMEQYVKPLTFFAHKMIRNKESAEEIVSDTFIKLWSARHGFETDGKVKAFLYITTHNACLDFIKSPKNQSSRRADLPESIISPGNDVLTKIIHAELISIINIEIARLPEQYATIFRLSYFKNLTTKEICEQLNVTENAVFTARSKAKKFLLEVLKDKDFLLYVAFIHLVNSDWIN
jgi:RNA polymerase sigma-70 factor (ECF subfamily)